MRLSTLLACLLTLPLLAAGAAQAHPHVFVAVKSAVLFGPDGRVTGVRHSWTFDDMYSAFATQGMGKAGQPSAEELKALAKVNVEQLAETGFFTFIRAGGKAAEFGEATDYTLTLDAKKLLTLHFTAPLKQPVSAGKALVMQVYDPTYFVAFDFEKTSPIALTSAPAGCSLRMHDPQPLTDTDKNKLNDSLGTNVSPGADFGMKLATRAIIACP